MKIASPESLNSSPMP